MSRAVLRAGRGKLKAPDNIRAASLTSLPPGFLEPEIRNVLLFTSLLVGFSVISDQQPSIDVIPETRQDLFVKLRSGIQTGSPGGGPGK